jgi:hypothetical protein
VLLFASLCSKASAGCQVMTWPTSVLDLCLQFYNLKLSIELFQFPSLNHAKRRPGPAWRGEWPTGSELEGGVAGRLALFQSIGWVPGNDLAYFGANASTSTSPRPLWLANEPLHPASPSFSRYIRFNPFWKRMNCWKSAPWHSARARVSSSVSLSNSGDIQFGCNGNFPKR